MFQRHALEKLHSDERLFTVSADFVDSADIRMIESGGCSRLAAKAFQGLRVLRQRVGQEFKGNETAKFGVLSLVDDSHAAATEFFDNAVVRNRLADHSEDELVWRRFILRRRHERVNE